MGNDLGKRHVCLSCQTRFYDLLKEKAVCPKCGSEQESPLQSEKQAASKPPRGRRRGKQAFSDFDHDTHEDDHVKETDIPLDLKTDL